jgi:hypothetical protein
MLEVASIWGIQKEGVAIDQSLGPILLKVFMNQSFLPSIIISTGDHPP